MECVLWNEQILLEKLSADNKKLFQKYVELQRSVNQLTAVKNFTYGFKLGLTMTAETFMGMDNLYTNGNTL